MLLLYLYYLIIYLTYVSPFIINSVEGVKGIEPLFSGSNPDVIIRYTIRLFVLRLRFKLRTTGSKPIMIFSFTNGV